MTTTITSATTATMRCHQQQNTKSTPSTSTSTSSMSHTHTTNIKTFNLSITPNIINESFTKHSKKNPTECGKNCANNIFRKKKYNNLVDEQNMSRAKPLQLQPPTSPTSPTSFTQTQCCCTTALEETLGKTQNINTNRRSTPNNKKTTPTKTMGKEKKSITTENIVGLAMTKCSLENLENSISLNADIDANAQQKQTATTTATTTTRRMEKTHTKSNNLIKKAMVVEKLKSTNSVITRKLFATKKGGAGGVGGAKETREAREVEAANSSTGGDKEMQEGHDSTDLFDIDIKNITLTTTKTTTTSIAANATTMQNDDDIIVQEDRDSERSMIGSLLRTTTL